jgi:hypothetical protein
LASPEVQTSALLAATKSITHYLGYANFISIWERVSDCASINGVGIDEIIGIFAYQFGFHDSPCCWSHTIDNAGKHFECDPVLFFITLWNGFFVNSLKAKALTMFKRTCRHVSQILQVKLYSDLLYIYTIIL